MVSGKLSYPSLVARENMGEKIAFDVAAKLLSSLGPEAIRQIGLAWGVEEELEKLKGIVSTINDVLLVAEQEQRSNSAVKDWLQRLKEKRLKEILCDADDLLDEVATETKRKELDTHNRSVRKVRDFFTSSNSFVYRRKVGSKIQDILKRLGQIDSEIQQLKSVAKPTDTLVNTPRIITRDETSSLVNTRRIIGREGDKKEFVKKLLSFGDQEKFLVIPIVGIGGLGKTTLAQLVYGDDDIQNHFPKRFWVRVSTDFNIERLLIKILQAGGVWDDRWSNKTFGDLEILVKSMLSKKKFLLFLDDVWNEDIREWNKLEDLLKTGASGSRIVVTTRSTTVASIVRSSIMEPYILRSLSDLECLTLLVKLAFKEGEEKKHKKLVNIGKEIAKECKGVPLAIATLGSLLFSKRDERDWLAVRDNVNEVWASAQERNDIIPVLRLSYDQMPSHLKPCFAYCSMFEKDKIIDGKKLLYTWMAQGFVQRLDGNDELEHIGNNYIRELVNRFFLEPYDGRMLTKTTGREHYKMHGLVHSLAQDVAGTECLTIKGGINVAIPRMLRHVAFDSETYSEFPRSLMEAKKLRTLFYLRKKNPKSGSSAETESTSFRCLRVYGYEDKISSPKKIRKLKLLRYLTLNGVDNFPKSLCKLLNLQYLDLSLSGDLESTTGSEKFINLRFLCFSSTLESLPNKGIGMLTSVRTLIIFRCEVLRSLEGIEHFSCLRELALESCFKLPSLPNGFKRLTSLERLEISSCLSLTLVDDDFEGLKRLKQLKLRELLGLDSLPQGLLDAAGTLTHLEIESCWDFTSPSESILPNLISLESLKIWDCEKVHSLPEAMHRLENLQFVSIVGCPFSTNCKRQEAERKKIEHVAEIELA